MPGAARVPKPRESVEQRMTKELARLSKEDAREGVQPLNAGFFKLEQIRRNSVAKARADVRPKMKGK